MILLRISFCWQFMKTFDVKVFLKCKNKRNLCIFLFLIMIQFPYSWHKVHILTRSYEKKSSNSGDYVTIPHGFCQFWQYLSCNFESKLFLLGVIVSVNRWRKDIKVTFVSSSFHSGRFTVICKEYGNKRFSYFDSFIYILLNFTLDLRIAKYLHGHIGLQLHTSFINFDLVRFWENWEKEF